MYSDIIEIIIVTMIINVIIFYVLITMTKWSNLFCHAYRD